MQSAVELLTLLKLVIDNHYCPAFMQLILAQTDLKALSFTAACPFFCAMCHGSAETECEAQRSFLEGCLRFRRQGTCCYTGVGHLALASTHPLPLNGVQVWSWVGTEELNRLAASHDLFLISREGKTK